MRLIDADALAMHMADWQLCADQDQWQVIEEVTQVIDNAPTIDAYGEGYKQGRFDAEADMDYIVRCKDCKCWTEWSNGTGSCSRFALDWIGTDADDFCSMGERKGDE